MQTPSGATSDTSVTDLLEDHFDSLGDFATSPRNNLSESPFPAVLASPGDSENSAKENAPTNETARKVVKNNILYEVDPSSTSISQEELESAKAEAMAWRASQEALVNRVHLLESRILEEAARADAGYSAAEAAQHSLAAGFGEFKQQSSLMVEECARREADLVAHFTALSHAKDDEHSVAILNLQEQLQIAVDEKNKLLETLEDDHREALELRGRVENSGQLRDAVRELTRQKKVLESQLYSAQSALEKERDNSKDISERLIAAESSAMQATQQAEAACKQWDTAVQEAQQAKQREIQLSNKLKLLHGQGTDNEDAVRNTAKEQLSALSELAQERGAALRQIANLLAGTSSTDNENENENPTAEGLEVVDKTAAAADSSRPSTAGGNDKKNGGVSRAAAVDPQYVVQLVISVCQGVIDAEMEWEKEREELHEALEEAMEGTEDLIRRLRKEESRNRELESQEADARAVLGAVEKIQNRAVMAENTLNACREELENAASKAAASVMEAAQLKAVAAAAEETLKLAEARALHAEQEAATLRQGSGAKEQRADEMRAAAAAAMDVAQSLQSSIQKACATAAAEMHHTAMELQPDNFSPTVGEDASQDSSALRLNTNQQETYSSANRILNSVYNCIDRLNQAAAIDTTSNANPSSKNELASAVESALLEASSGFAHVAELVQEYMRVHAALLRAVDRPTGTQELENLNSSRDGGSAGKSQSQETSLESLLSDLLDRLSGLTAAVQSEKSNLEEELSSLRAEHAELLTHAESLESVLRSAVHAGPGTDMDTTGEALLQLVAARRRIAELEAECVHLNESAQQAQHAAEESKSSASRDWADVRADVAQLVQHAERAQIDAESALQQQRAETARLVSEARAREQKAAAARSEAEAQASQLREEAAMHSRELQAALITATTWETRAKLAEDALDVARTRLQEAKQQQQQQQQTDNGKDDDTTKVAGLQPAVQLSCEDIDTLRRRVIQLESALGELQEHAATSAKDLIEARAKTEIAEEAAAAHHAASEAAMRQVDIATTRATEAEKKYAALELEYLEHQTTIQQQQQQRQASQTLQTSSPPPPSLMPSSTTGRNQDDDIMVKTTLNMPPHSADNPTLRRRLEAALRQIEGLKSLNANLQQQLVANASSLTLNTLSNQSQHQQRQALNGKNLADETAHAMIDALQLQMASMGMITRKSQRNGEESKKMLSVVPGDATIMPSSSSNVDDHANGPVQRVVALWKQACAARDEKLEEAARRLQSAGIDLGAKEAELAAMRQAAKALKQARNEAITAATEMERRMREALAVKRSLEAQLAAATTGLGDRVLLRERINSLEMQYKALEKQATVSEMRAVQAEGALAAARATAVASSEQMRRCEEAENRARAANERASEAENALSRHLESHSQQDKSTSLGKQLEAAWATERQLAKRVQEMQIEAAGAKSELETAVKDVEMYAERAAALQEQLNEAVGALAEQGAALEAVQFALQQEKQKARMK